jgi:ligand-binding sensor domain-containing protein
LDIDGKKWIATGNEAACLLGNDFEGCTGIGCTASEITVDQLGGKWFSTDAGVLTYIQDKWTTYDMSNSDLPDDFVLDVAIDWWSRKWFATQSGGLVRLDGEGWTVFNPENSDIPDRTITAIGVDSNNHIWVGTPRSGAAKFDGETWAVYDTTGGRLGTSSIGDIAVDPQGNVWFGLKAEFTQSSSAGSGRRGVSSAQLYGGVTKFDGTTWTTYTPVTTDGMLPDVTTIVARDENDVWIGGFSGASHFDGATWEWFNPDNSGLPDYSVNAIAPDRDGFVWFGTYEGLARYRE